MKIKSCKEGLNLLSLERLTHILGTLGGQSCFFPFEGYDFMMYSDGWVLCRVALGKEKQ